MSYYFHLWTQFDWKFNYELNEVWHSTFRQLFFKLWQKNWLFDDRNLKKTDLAKKLISTNGIFVITWLKMVI